MGIVTLTTDLGLKDSYVGSVKGSLIREAPDLQIVDVSHDIKKFDILHAAFVVKQVYRDFPDGTIHLVGVDTSPYEDARHLAVSIHQQFFILPDNGMLNLIFESKPDEVVEITLVRDASLITFPLKDIYVKTAGHISRGGSLSVIGKEIEDVREMLMFQARTEMQSIVGSVVHIDSYGNAITNITKSHFAKYSKYPSFSIVVGHDHFNEIHKVYHDVVDGEKVAIFNGLEMLELSINKGNASKLMGIELQQVVRVEFNDN